MSQDLGSRVRHPAGGLVTVNGRELWVEREGSGEPLLLLGGFGPAGSHTVFHPHFDPLTADHEVIYVDLFARGRSGQPAGEGSLAGVTFDSDVADVACLINRLGLGSVHLYGFSYGGLVAQAVALDHPDRVRSLILANSLHSAQMWQQNHENINNELRNQFPVEWRQIEAGRAEGRLSTQPEMQALFANAAAIVRFFNPDNAKLVATEPGDRNRELYREFVGPDIDFIVGRQIATLPDFRPRLQQLRVPLMVLAGRFDRALYPLLQLEYLSAAPDCTLHFMERSGSYAHVEESERVMELVRSVTKRAGRRLQPVGACGW